MRPQRTGLQEWFAAKLTEFEKEPEFQVERLLIRVNEQICEAMEKQGLSKADLARKLGVSRAFVTKLLNGKPNITMRTLVEVAMALGLTVNVTLCEPQPRSVRRATTPRSRRRAAAPLAAAAREPKARYGRKR